MTKTNGRSLQHQFLYFQITGIIKKKWYQDDSGERTFLGKQSKVEKQQAQPQKKFSFAVMITDHKEQHQDHVEKAQDFVTAFDVCNDLGMDGMQGKQQGNQKGKEEVITGKQPAQ